MRMLLAPDGLRDCIVGARARRLAGLLVSLTEPWGS